MYPYIASIKAPSLYQSAISANILEPVEIGHKERQTLILQQPNEITLYKINHKDIEDNQSDALTLISSQPIFTQILKFQKIKWRFQQGEKQMTKDFILMMNNELNMHILDFDKSQNQLRIISTFNIELQKYPKEVFYSSFDDVTQSVIIVFESNQVLTINISEYNGKDKDPSINYPLIEITNYSVNCTMDTENSCRWKKIKIKEYDNQYTSYLCLLYDQALEDQENITTNGPYYQIDLRRLKNKNDGNLIKTSFFKEPARLSLHDFGDPTEDKYFLFVIYSSKIDSFIGITDEQIFLFKIDIFMNNKNHISLQKNIFKLLNVDFLIRSYKWMGDDRLLLIGENGDFQIIEIKSSKEFNQETLDLKGINLEDVDVDLVCLLNFETILITSQQQNHYILKIEGTNLVKIQQLENTGSIIDIKKYKPNSGALLTHSQEQSKIYYLKDTVDYKEDYSIQIPDNIAIHRLFNLNDEQNKQLIFSYAFGDFQLFDISRQQMITNDRYQQEKGNCLIKIYDNSLFVYDNLIIDYNTNNQYKPEEKTRILSLQLIKDGYIALIDNNTLITFNKNLNVMNECKFQNEYEIHDISSVIMNDITLLAVSFWNSSVINFYKISDLRKPIIQLNLVDFVSFDQFQIDKINIILLSNDYYLTVSLNNGYIVIFNLYIKMLDTLLKLNQELNQLFRLCNVFKIGNVIYDIVTVDSNYIMVCSDQSKLLVQDSQSRAKQLRCLKLNEEEIKTAAQIGDKIALYIENFVVIGNIDLESIMSRNMKVQTIPFIVQRFEVIEELEVTGLCIFNQNSQNPSNRPQLALVDLNTNRRFYQKYFTASEIPSAIKYYKASKNCHYIILGTSIIGNTQEIAPSTGYINVFKIVRTGEGEDMEYSVQDGSNDKTKVDGAVLDLEIMRIEKDYYLVAAINSHIMFFSLNDLCSNKSSPESCLIDKQTFVKKIVVSENLVLVGDIMKSLTIYEITPGEDKVETDENDEERINKKLNYNLISRDSRGQLCNTMIKIDETNYLISDFYRNLILLQRQNVNQPENPIPRINQDDLKLFKLASAYNLGEFVTNIVSDIKQNSIEEDGFHPEDVFLSHQYLQYKKLPMNQSFFDQDKKFENLKSLAPIQPIIVTADGGIYMTLLLEFKAYQLLNAIQTSLNENNENIGNYQQKYLRKPKVSNSHSLIVLQQVNSDEGINEFIDGDYIETLLELKQDEQLRIVNHAKQSLYNQLQKDLYSSIGLKEIVMLISHLRQIHQ